MTYKFIISALAGVFFMAGSALAADYLLYLEAQGVAGYSSQTDDVGYYSHMPEEAMQKPSLGFDFLKRFSGESGDFGAAALQFRLAYDDFDNDLQPQVYNAYFKYKAGWSDLWVGHNRPALGLSSYFDTHALLLPTLPMNGFGFDRDWGAGSYKDFDWGNVSLSVTTGTGMPVRFEGNYLAAARISKGILNQDNYNAGLSVSYGETLAVMGYEVMDDDPEETALGGADASYLWDIFEIRGEVMAGEIRDESATAVFLRGGMNLLEEGRLKLEAQPVYLKTGGRDNYQLAAGLSYQLTGDIALRTMYQYDDDMEDHRVVAQVYLYKGI